MSIEYIKSLTKYKKGMKKTRSEKKEKRKIRVWKLKNIKSKNKIKKTEEPRSIISLYFSIATEFFISVPHWYTAKYLQFHRTTGTKGA